VGVDFIDKIKRTFEKHLDVGRRDLGTSDLFMRAPTEARPTFTADVVRGARLGSARELIVEVSGNSLTLSDGLNVVARVDGAPAEITQAIRDSCGIATAVIQEVHPISGVIEVTLC
jgi:hypothetical protein